MAALFSDGTGKVIATWLGGGQGFVPTAGQFAFSAIFDPTTNPVLRAAVADATATVTLPANNAPSIAGVPYVIIAGGADYATDQLIATVITALTNAVPLSAAAASQVQAGTATLAQLQVHVANLDRMLAYLLKTLRSKGVI